MENLILYLKLTRYFEKKKPGIEQSCLKGNAGFTLVELLVVILLMGVIAAIAAPSWIGFVTQRRVTAANEVALRALQEAQSQAKTTKQNYSVTIRTPTGKVPQIAVHRAVSKPTDLPADGSALWRSLGKDLELNNKQVWIGTNATGANKAGSNISSPKDDKKTVATFDLSGALQADPKPDLGNKGLIIAVAQPQPNDVTQRIEATTRCVKVTTLLGTIEIGRRVDECKAS